MNDTPVPNIPVFDGHNDTLLHLYLPERGAGRSFFVASTRGHIDLPRARLGGFGGGFFAIFVPSERTAKESSEPDFTQTATGYEVRMAPPVDLVVAQKHTLAMMAELFRLEAASEGQVKVVRNADELATCLRSGVLAMVLHCEGAEAIDPELNALEVFYAAGLRSLGLVWSRPNAFGWGVPFKYPASPDTGPGLTEAGQNLVRACNRLGIMVDMAHLNEQGFWDVARISEAPLVVTHAGVHALCPMTRNLTDRQLDAIGASGGVVGTNFAVSAVRADGQDDGATPLSDIVRHIDYVANRIGIDHVALGSDFDGARIPDELGDVAGLPKLLAALRAHGYDDAALHKVAHENWERVLRATWHPRV